MPTPQAVQLAAPLMSEYVPVSQGEQVIVPELGADEPGAHELQALEPVWSWKKPGLQLVHEELPAMSV